MALTAGRARVLELLLRAHECGSYAITVGYGLFQGAPELVHIHVAFAAGDEEGPVVTEVAAPLNHLFIAPRRLIQAHLVVRHAVQIRAQIVAGLVRMLVHKRLLLEIPNGLLHNGFLSYRKPFNLTNQSKTLNTEEQ